MCKPDSRSRTVVDAASWLAEDGLIGLATHVMGKEYKIKCKVPNDAGIAAMFRRLPSPIHRKPLSEIYNYKIEADGFYFIDQLVDTKTASVALRIFIDAALVSNQTIEISEP
jgi:hypothetical protein